jgi:hypothetical protein
MVFIGIISGGLDAPPTPWVFTGRATTYIAGGSHANYVSVGKQDYSAPFGLLSDTTDAGPYWDVTQVCPVSLSAPIIDAKYRLRTQNYRGFWYDNATSTFTSAGGAGIGASEQSGEGVSWLSFAGMWGDQQYPSSDPRQNCDFGECHYEDGPTGEYVF